MLVVVDPFRYALRVCKMLEITGQIGNFAVVDELGLANDAGILIFTISDFDDVDSQFLLIYSRWYLEIV